jgi:hypothetical protein
MLASWRKTRSTIFGDRPADASSSTNSFGTHHEGAGNRQHLALAAGQPAGELTLAFAQHREEREHCVDGRVTVMAGKDGRGERKIVGNGHAGEDVFRLRHEGETVADKVMSRRVGNVSAIKKHATAEFWHQPGDGLDERRLAGAVRSENGDDLTRRDPDAGAAHDG